MQTAWLHKYEVLPDACGYASDLPSTKVLIQRMVKKQLVLFVKRIAPVIPSLYVVDADIPVSELSKDEEKLEKVLLGREFHISLG
ncbi:hypothetical protein J5N97_018609 [Dioscorea zingiberensis]|uniref:Uncharacterized protein n=1 Tax=Dioscorea zingiberensis TaxID=325984 RepID=A0A9D5HBY2_9LILI|nr:hypothetical protein J5N97_018609 [Dioscorea zingiberensis]